jgi:2-keto-4-pentenoate hydratase/2-oxohepta-3-ene-1,7-dioic acid hydratase in catechol pathway
MAEKPHTTFRLGTFSQAGGSRFPGLFVDERVLPLARAADWLHSTGRRLPASASVLAMLEHWDAAFPLLQAAADALAAGEPLAQHGLDAGSLAVHPPVDLPRQIFCSGANYKRHVVQIIVAQQPEETRGMSEAQRRAFAERKMDERAASGTPFCFVKAQSSVTGPFDPVVLPHDVEKPDWELELAVVIGRRARRVPRQEALSCVAGYTIANDITSRERLLRRHGDLRDLGHDWTAGKCSPSYLPLGPYLTPAAFVPDPQRLQITLRLNGEVMQDESTADMIFGVARLVEYLSTITVLLPGDVVCTGSPAGNGVHYQRFLRPGDVLEGSISGLGSQRNTCIAEPA